MVLPAETSPAGSPPTSGRRAHLSFPPVDPSSNADTYGDHSSIGLGPPPSLRHASAGLEVKTSGEYQTEGRRRVRSANATGALPARPQHQKHVTAARRRTLTTADQVKTLKAEKGRWIAGSVDSSLDELEPGVFSDEYDLSHEDPKILEDVQRALKLKLRREARLQAARVNDSSVSTSSRSSPVRYSLPPLNPQASRIAKPSLESELDFSPSVGIDHLHPVPTSMDDGATLDWGGTLSEEDKADRRWSLSITKRKPKDRPIVALSKDALERQESNFSERISRIKAFSQPHTLKKATITADQLRRRYAFLSTALKTEPRAGNPILTVVKWCAGLDPLVQATLEQAEPLTWLKHLRAKRPGRTPRFPWHVTALLFEERVRAQARLAAMAMETIPEDVLSSLDSPQLSRSSPERSHLSPSYHPHFMHASRDHLHPSLSRRRSDDGHVSFEPIIEPNRRSLEDLRQNSLYSGIFNGSRARGASSSSSRIYLRDLAARVRRRGNESDEASSSHQSASEDVGRVEDPSKKNDKRRHFFKPPDLDLVSRTQLSTDPKAAGEDDTPAEWMSSPETAVQEPRGSRTLGLGEISAGRRPLEQPQSAFQSLEASIVVQKVSPRPDRLLRGSRTSLPSSLRPSWSEEEQVDEEAEREEYERRRELLENATAQNQRNRYLLQRIANGIKEYEAVQAKMSKALGLTYNPLPPELIDAFSHDPAVVTGSTRQKRSWQAVEDIHGNIARQRNTVRKYLQQARHEEVTPPESVLDSPLKSLQQSLDALERRRSLIFSKVQEVTETLARVKQLHASVKAEYNNAMAHTSSVYPELSEIIALEERYKDRYQQLWELGMDALTILLDTVTPFWRNYGKVIGVDAQDFLIIPWYRNEFTGEPERYPIKALPRRSFRHWVALILFFFITLAILILQTRAASSFSSLYRMPFNASPGLWWISAPSFGITALILWTAVLVETCIVGAQLAVVLWWIGWRAGIFD
ncbi:hypothetical protein B0F90DRAFT_130923 [Multifurca ochricompacta]|uniref:Uncharacterized protein n=1 Tax=Multifurca ochricompacta TaxID=376703 RepID=A0AAD4MDN7_9AGAM|nr:hypothetical protein B0F90DRAFT_130923 [Multifurca ochricompacta]